LEAAVVETALHPETQSPVVYRCEVRIEPRVGGVKMVHLPCESEAVPMGLHGAIARHYKMAEGTYTPHASTLDYIVGSVAGCLTGTLSRALVTRNIATGDGRLTIEAVGEIECEEGVLVIRRIRMLAHLQANPTKREAAEDAVAGYAMKCPVYRSLYKAIDITTELDFQALA
jgi:uncharacterized OsmC-like protein